MKISTNLDKLLLFCWYKENFKSPEKVNFNFNSKKKRIVKKQIFLNGLCVVENNGKRELIAQFEVKKIERTMKKEISNECKKYLH